MTVAFGFFEGKAKKMRLAIAEIETRVESKRAEMGESEDRLRDTLKSATEELARAPLAGSLTWKKPPEDDDA